MMRFKNVVAQFIGREEPDKSGNYRRKNPKHEILNAKQYQSTNDKNSKQNGFWYSNLEF
jgi:hypothetical protein